MLKDVCNNQVQEHEQFIFKTLKVKSAKIYLYSQQQSIT